MMERLRFGFGIALDATRSQINTALESECHLNTAIKHTFRLVAGTISIKSKCAVAVVMAPDYKKIVLSRADFAKNETFLEPLMNVGVTDVIVNVLKGDRDEFSQFWTEGLFALEESEHFSKDPKIIDANTVFIYVSVRQVA